MTYTVGDVLAGGYRIFDVKSGGMGVVYLCVQPPDRYYAVKTVHSEAVVANPYAAQKFLEYFRGEVDSWIRVSREARHPNIVEALLYNEQEGWLFLEYVNGLSLQDAAGKRPLHMKHVRDWGIGIAKGMEVMHRDFSLIHRDLKPLNVLIEAKGLVPKISDLGIAKVAEGEEDNTIIGTRGYRAPETLVGQTTFCSDIYSYGATLYYMATGQCPADGQQEPLVPPRKFNPRLPQPLEDIIVNCLAVDPKSRPQSFGEVLEALDAAETVGEDDRYRECAEHEFYFLTNANQGCPFCQSQASHREQLRGSLEATRTGSDPFSPTVRQGSTGAAGTPVAGTREQVLTERQTLAGGTAPQATVTGHGPIPASDDEGATITSPRKSGKGGAASAGAKSKLPLAVVGVLVLVVVASFWVPGVPWASSNGDPGGRKVPEQPKSGNGTENTGHTGNTGNTGSTESPKGTDPNPDIGDPKPSNGNGGNTSESGDTGNGGETTQVGEDPTPKSEGPWECSKCGERFSDAEARARRWHHRECNVRLKKTK